jgi:hypothetical protein
LISKDCRKRRFSRKKILNERAEIVEAYLGIIFKGSITPAFQASQVMTNEKNINSNTIGNAAEGGVLKHPFVVPTLF